MDIDNSQSKLLNFLKINSKIFIYILITLCLIIVSIVWYTNSNKAKHTQISDSFIKAQILIDKGKNNEAKDILLNLMSKKNSPYSSLSLFLIIEYKLIDNKETIIRYFDEIMNNKSFKDEDLNLLKLKKAIYISEIDKEGEIIELLNPIINSESVWKAQSIKFLGDFYFSKKEYKKADQYYSTLLALENPNIDGKEIKRKIKTYKK